MIIRLNICLTLPLRTCFLIAYYFLGPNLNEEKMEERNNIKRKTKSERDKGRSSRASLIEDCSESEDFFKRREGKHSRYRKRAGSKRLDSDAKTKDDTNRKSITSKITSSVRRIQGKETTNVQRNSKGLEYEAQPKMDDKDIYFGTWNNKERAVLDQILQNLDRKPTKKIKEKDKFNRKSRTYKPSSKNDEIIISGSNNSLDCNNKENERNRNKSRLLAGLKKVFVRQENDSQEVSDAETLNTYTMPQKKKRGLFQWLLNRKKLEEPPRRRAFSTNDTMNMTRIEPNHLKVPSLAKRSLSSTSVKGLITRTKSADDLDGAFDFYTNKNQVFQRTPSIAKLQGKSKYTSMEKIANEKLSGTQNSPSHGFQQVKPSVKDICYDNNKLIYAQSHVNHTKTASNRSISISSYSSTHQEASEYISSCYEDDACNISGYQSDQPVPMSSFISSKYQRQCQDEDFRQIQMGVSSCPLIRKKYYPKSYRQFPFTKTRNTRSSYQRYKTSASVNSSLSAASTGEQINTTYCLDSDHFSETGSPKITLPPPYPSHLSKRPVMRSFSKNSSISTYSSNNGYLSESSNFEEETGLQHFEPRSLQNYSSEQFDFGFTLSSVKSQCSLV